jgi:hypothetical protein
MEEVREKIQTLEQNVIQLEASASAQVHSVHAHVDLMQDQSEDVDEQIIALRRKIEVDFIKK